MKIKGHHFLSLFKQCHQLEPSIVYPRLGGHLILITTVTDCQAKVICFWSLLHFLTR